MKKTVKFYIDGFNFYRGLKEAKWKKYYWIDLVKLSQNLVRKYKDFEVIEVNYFTAKPIFNQDQLKRQGILFNVNKKLNPGLFNLHYGEYQKKNIKCLADCQKEFLVPTEKRTDVNIATQIMGDYFLKKCDVIALVTGDNDLIPPIKLIKEIDPQKEIFIFYPPFRDKSELFKYANKAVRLFDCTQLFIESKMDEKIDFQDGTSYTIPEKWKKP
jgi:hypothetical protein